VYSIKAQGFVYIFETMPPLPRQIGHFKLRKKILKGKRKEETMRKKSR
jgi:hypothetical protein